MVFSAMESKRKHFSSGAPWESIAGYSRAVQIGPHVWVSGTTAVEAGEVVHPGDAAGQCQFIITKIQSVLEAAGLDLASVVRTRMFVVEAADAEAVMQVHGRLFGDIQPAATLVIVKALVNPELLVEIEVDAYQEKS